MSILSWQPVAARSSSLCPAEAGWRLWAPNCGRAMQHGPGGDTVPRIDVPGPKPPPECWAQWPALQPNTTCRSRATSVTLFVPPHPGRAFIGKSGKARAGVSLGVHDACRLGLRQLLLRLNRKVCREAPQSTGCDRAPIMTLAPPFHTTLFYSSDQSPGAVKGHFSPVVVFPSKLAALRARSLARNDRDQRAV
jgi:hypothetical protein